MRDQLFIVLNEYLTTLDIHLNQSELELQILSHPSHPSLHAVTGVLDHFNIQNIALEVSADLETLKQLPQTFITLIEGEKNREFVVASQFDNDIKVTYGNKKKAAFTVERFLPNWSGIILVAEKDQLNNESVSTHTKGISNSLYTLFGIFLISAFFMAKPTLLQSLHFIFTISGLFISFLISRHELGFRSKALNKFCTSHESSSCDAVLNSKGATVLKNFKLSDFSLVYFTSLALSWIITIKLNSSDSAFLLISLLTIPVTIYSLYYQFSVIKKWCPLCLAIVLVLWAQVGLLFSYKNPSSFLQLDFNSASILCFSFLVASSLWLFIKPLLKTQQTLYRLQISHNRFKRNFDLFDSMYRKGKLLEITPIHDAEVVLGNRKAPLHILLVTNPKCHYCKEAHSVVMDILKKRPESIKITVRFNLGKTDRSNQEHKIACRIIELYNTKSESHCIQALDEAYKVGADLAKWLFKWKESDNKEFDKVLETHQLWCQNNGINFTPAVYINGRLYPKEYEKSDLPYFIDDLIEKTESERDKNPEQYDIMAN